MYLIVSNANLKWLRVLVNVLNDFPVKNVAKEAEVKATTCKKFILRITVLMLLISKTQV